MSRNELYLEISSNSSRVRRVRVPANRRLFVVGSGKEADLVIPSRELEPVHFALEKSEGQWWLRSLVANEEAVVYNGQPVVEALLQEGEIKTQSVVVKVHQGSQRQLEFNKSAQKEVSTDSTTVTQRHQVVVFKRGRLVKSLSLATHQSFNAENYGLNEPLAPPSNSNWVENKVGEYSIQRRLVSVSTLDSGNTFALDPELKRSFQIASAIILVLVSLLIAIPRPSPEQAVNHLDQKSIDMIFNSDAIKKKRAEAREIKVAAQKSGGQQQALVQDRLTQFTNSEAAQTKVSNEKVAAALTSIRHSGLAALVGRVAARANKNAIQIESAGVSAATQGAGHALYSNGKALAAGASVSGPAGTTVRLGGVATHGFGGGASGVRNGTALVGGKIGLGDVAMVDEETLIEGGLDRDVIADVIKQNLGQIRYCYERQLSSNPDLFGKLLVRFIIGADGLVAQPGVESSTLKNAMIEGCVLRRLAAWRFPLPKGGTQVKVTYPFLFKATD